jgi:hypothetical protein
MESINQKTFKHIYYYLPLEDIARLKQSNKSWSTKITDFLTQHFPTELKWIESANKLATNNQLMKFKEILFDDYVYIPHLGLMLKIFYVDDKTLRLNFLSLNVHRYSLLPLSQKTNHLKIYYFMDIFWNQSKKLLISKAKSFLVEINLSNLENISIQLIKKRRISNGSYFAYNQSGNRILSINLRKNKDIGVHLQIKYKKVKNCIKLKLGDFWPSQLLSFGTDHVFSLVIYDREIVIIDNRNPTNFQKIDVKTHTITSYYWNENNNSFHYLMNQKWSSLILDNNGKWLSLSGKLQPKVDYYFGEWCPTWRKFVPFQITRNSDGFHLEQWIKCTRKYHLTISDILKLEKGDQIRVVHLDRNILDTCEYHNKPSVITEPHNFFKQSIGIYTHDENLKGWFKFIEDSRQDFEFDVEYKKNHWYPLENGRLPDSNDNGICCSFGNKKGWSWRQFPLDTRIGWRGPMIEISKLEHCPKVYYADNEPCLLI